MFINIVSLYNTALGATFVCLCVSLPTLLDTNHSRRCSLFCFFFFHPSLPISLSLSLFALQLISLQKVGCCTAKACFARIGSIWTPNDEWVERGERWRWREGRKERERERERRKRGRKEVCKVTGVPPRCQRCNRDRLRWEGRVPFLSVSNAESR